MASASLRDRLLPHGLARLVSLPPLSAFDSFEDSADLAGGHGLTASVPFEAMGQRVYRTRTMIYAGVSSRIR